jgi:hypothetical protein
VLQAKFPKWETVPSYTAIVHVCRIHSYLLFLITAVVPQLVYEETVFKAKMYTISSPF